MTASTQTTRATDRQAIRLKDYQPTNYLIEQVHLHFDLHADHATVKAIIDFYRHPEHPSFEPVLQLHGEDLELTQISLDGQELKPTDYQINAQGLRLENTPERFTLETCVRLYPQKNTQLSGLYTSSGNFCTQNEPHGFRRITYFYDRPDVMTRFTTCISADKAQYPLLLSNGNLIEERELEDGRHWVKWQDPSKKPCYLFALVAGSLEEMQDEFITCSGKKVQLRLFVENGYLDQAGYAMGALKRSMRWDEEAYGREYDLDVFMIVAVSDFNMGAMENKGLNIFNTKYILAKPETATDIDFIAIEEVIGHEYFHNWSGNRVTCRDWFQITLKEGLTVFRDQNFTMDMTSAGVKRIDDVNVIRNVQFLQDAGPMAHPIRPEEYIEINNFYTVTVYNKGAEVIRMLQTMLGKALFRQGLDLYFERHDESAVTTEDFLQAMADVSKRDLTQFKHWYNQAGTPDVHCSGVYDSQAKTWTLTVKQSCPDTPDQAGADKKPFVIPLAMGLLDINGQALPLILDTHPDTGAQQLVLELTAPQHTFVFHEIPSEPVPSLLRDFSAPVQLHYTYSMDEHALLLKYDQNDYVRWDAGQSLMTRSILQVVDDIANGTEPKVDPRLIDSLRHLLQHLNDDRQLSARLLTLPSENFILQQMSCAKVEEVYAARLFVQQTLARELAELWLYNYTQCHRTTAYEYNATAIGLRACANVCLSYLTHTIALQNDPHAAISLVQGQFTNADNMTQQMGALAAINQIDNDLRTILLQQFYQQWSNQPLIMDKWLMLQASCKLPHTLEHVKELLNHPAFDANNPNKIRALVGTFSSNLIHFHAENGSGYTFLTEQIIQIDAKNPQIAARLCEPLTRWQRFDKARQQKIIASLQKIADNPACSKDVYEVVSKSLTA